VRSPNVPPTYPVPPLTFPNRPVSTHVPRHPRTRPPSMLAQLSNRGRARQSNRAHPPVQSNVTELQKRRF